MSTADAVRWRIRLSGIVQGVGLRPFVRRVAGELALGGFVRNDADGAWIEVEGGEASVREFVEVLRRDPPPLARIRDLSCEPVAPRGEREFTIAESDRRGPRRALVSPDVATCDACLAEVLDPGDRRYGYAFTNCTRCGPRFTIVRDVPYDRAATTMASFPMCDRCAREYEDPEDRRYHAQPVCCAVCGPRLALLDARGAPQAGDPVAEAVARLAAGQVVAVKGLGGFHLAVRAGDERAVATLRRRKRRHERPLAVLAPDLAGARGLVHLDAAQERVLTGPRRPIVLAPRRPDAPVAPSVAPGNRWLGVMLPYTPLHLLLARAAGEPLVLTSGNLSDEPIAIRDDEVLERLGDVADALLTHDRPIQVRCDDSVVRVLRGHEMPIRRSRGYAPQPLLLPFTLRRPVLGCGAALKNTFCVAVDDRAFLSQHVGDLDDHETFRAFEEGVAHFCRLFDVAPELLAHDLHPDYLSTKFAVEWADRSGAVALEPVQHHHAHAAACLAEHGESGPAIAVCWDGLGLGSDGTAWGGEILLAGLADFERVGHLHPVPLPGSDAAAREPWRMAAVYLDAAFGAALPDGLEVVRRNRERWGDVLAIARAGLASPPTSSVGRLFDGAAALLGVRDRVSYEGQAAVELEQLADPRETAAYEARVGPGAEGGAIEIHGSDLVAAIVEDLRRDASPSRIAARFHNGLARCLVRVCGLVRRRRAVGTVALTGGVFQNALLLDRASEGLAADGFRVLVHERVPPNDGGLSFGQVAVAGARDRSRA